MVSKGGIEGSVERPHQLLELRTSHGGTMASPSPLHRALGSHWGGYLFLRMRGFLTFWICSEIACLCLLFLDDKVQLAGRLCPPTGTGHCPVPGIEEAEMNRTQPQPSRTGQMQAQSQADLGLNSTLGTHRPCDPGQIPSSLQAHVSCRHWR